MITPAAASLRTTSSATALAAPLIASWTPSGVTKRGSVVQFSEPTTLFHPGGGVPPAAGTATDTENPHRTVTFRGPLFFPYAPDRTTLPPPLPRPGSLFHTIGRAWSKSRPSS